MKLEFCPLNDDVFRQHHVHGHVGPQVFTAVHIHCVIQRVVIKMTGVSQARAASFLRLPIIKEWWIFHIRIELTLTNCDWSERWKDRRAIDHLEESSITHINCYNPFGTSCTSLHYGEGTLLCMSSSPTALSYSWLATKALYALKESIVEVM